MDHLTAADVLSRYAAGERDFRAANLSGLRLCGANLSGADFSGADLRSTDFSDARLECTIFSHALGGRQLHWSIVVLAMAFILAGISGVFIGMVSTMINGVLFLPPEVGIPYLPAIIGFGAICCGSAFFLMAWEGPTTRALITIAYAAATGVAFVITGMIAGSLTGLLFGDAIAGGVAGTGFFIGLLALSAASTGIGGYAISRIYCLASSIARSVYGASTAAAVIAISGAVAIILSISYSYLFASFKGAGIGIASAIISVIINLCFLVISITRMTRGAPGYALTQAMGSAIATIGGTRFNGANLQGAFLSGAQLRGSNFASSPRRPTNLDQVCLKGARGLEWARLGGTILADPRILHLLVDASGRRQDYSNLNLRGAYLAGADLREAGLRNCILSGAILAGAHLEGSNLAGAQCLGTDFREAYLTGVCLEAWNIDNSTNLHGVDCAYVYLLEPHDTQGHCREEHHRERLPHDPDKSFEPGDFEAYFKQVLEEVKLLIRNGVDPKAFQHAFKAVMQQHPKITPRSLTGIKLIGNDVMATLQVPAGTDKAAVERTFDKEYLHLMLENERLKALLEGERHRADDHRKQVHQVLQTVARLNPCAPPTTININNRPKINIDNERTSAMTHNEINAGDGNFINSGTFQSSGGVVNLGALSDQARINIEALPDTRQADDQPSLRELLHQLKASIDADTFLTDTNRADALAEVDVLAQAAQDPANNASLARRSINALKGLNEGIGESFKFATTLKSLLPLIAGFF